MLYLRTSKVQRKRLKMLIAGFLVLLTVNACDALNAIEAEFTKADVVVTGHDGETYELHAVTQGSSPSVKVGTLSADGTLEWFAAEDIAAEASYTSAETLLCADADASDINVTPATAEGSDMFFFAYMLALPPGTTVDDAQAQATADEEAAFNVVAATPIDELFMEDEPSNSVFGSLGLVFTPQPTTLEVACPFAYGNLDLQTGFNEILATLTVFGGGASQFITTDVDPQAFDWNFESVPGSTLFHEIID